MQGFVAEADSEHSWSSMHYNMLLNFLYLWQYAPLLCQTSLWGWQWCFAWLAFSQLSAFSSHLKMYPSHHFCACQQLLFSFHSVIIFQVLYSILWRMTYRDSFTLWEKSWEEKFMVQYVTQGDICASSQTNNLTWI